MAAKHERFERPAVQIHSGKEPLAGVKVEGRKSYAGRDPDAVALARKLARERPKGGRRSLREIATEMERAGFLAASGKPYGAAAVARMLAG